MISIVDYNAGNLRSVERACRAVGAESVITQDPAAVSRAERIVFPGVGAAPSAMETLRATGLDDALRAAYNRGTPILGICLGTQVVLERSEEGPAECLGLVQGQATRFRPSDPALKVPHMGWNGVEIARPHPVLEGIRSGDEFYFVHSYYPDRTPEDEVYGLTEYEITFCSALARGSLFATQFHPEKSGRFGLKLLENFAAWKP